MDPNRYMITQGCKKNSDAMTEFWCNDPRGSLWTPRMWITHQNITYPSLTLRGYIRPEYPTPISQLSSHYLTFLREQHLSASIKWNLIYTPFDSIIHCAYIPQPSFTSVLSVTFTEERIWRRFSVNSPLDQVSFDAFPLSTQYKCQSIHNLSFMAYLLSKSRANNQKYREQ